MEQECPISSYKWWPKSELNRRHKDFQSFALPTELSGHTLADQTGFEPAVPSVTGRYVNRYTTDPTIRLLIIEYSMENCKINLRST